MDVADILAAAAKIEIPPEHNTHWGWGKLAYVCNKLYGTNYTALELKAEVLRGRR
jgi:hypothetical protein